ncbi:CerR family C-terminal domain-containing protein [Sphingomonas sp. BAUL-RG-20F-R05-02]|uniref:CerR family C-terminal domain-containing protein n=1 Tax=Sphingomonas sp. BAUL-RG-20F-R05-02 TaxID=2914830 RepID=UPI001F599FBE|nr:CerR family C-terminal domain-containing protein [Sphingomonas sp. BAUL-RG-20F-R05-02]
MVHDRLLDIAIREFGEKGLDGASTRSIASAAGTAMSSITYHYGSKQGLYLAVADYIAEHMASEMLPVLDLANTAPLRDPQAARAKIHHILNAFAQRMMGQKSAALSMFIMREQLHPGEAFDRLYEAAMGQVLDYLSELVAVATDAPADERTRLFAFLLAAQVFSLRSARGALLRVAGQTATEGPFAQSLTSLISFNTDAMLDRLHADRQETA